MTRTSLFGIAKGRRVVSGLWNLRRRPLVLSARMAGVRSISASPGTGKRLPFAASSSCDSTGTPVSDAAMMWCTPGVVPAMVISGMPISMSSRVAEP